MPDKKEGAGIKYACTTMACIAQTKQAIENIQKAIEEETEKEREESPAICLHRRYALEQRKMLLEEYKSLMTAPSYEDVDGTQRIAGPWRIFQAGTPLESIHRCIVNTADAYAGYMPGSGAIVVYNGCGTECEVYKTAGGADAAEQCKNAAAEYAGAAKGGAGHGKNPLWGDLGKIPKEILDAYGIQAIGKAYAIDGRTAIAETKDGAQRQMEQEAGRLMASMGRGEGGYTQREKAAMQWKLDQLNQLKAYTDAS